MHRRRWLLAAQCAFTAGVLVWLAVRLNLREAGDVLLSANGWLLAAATIQLSLQPLLAAWRWKIVIAALDGSLPFGLALRQVWIGAFVAQVLPTSISGDAVRMWLYWLHSRNKRLAVNTVILERLLLVAGLLAFALACLPAAVVRGIPKAIAYPLAVSLVCVLLGGAVVAALPRWLPARRAIPFLDSMLAASSDLARLLTSARAMTTILPLCLASYLNLCLCAWLIGSALGIGLAAIDYLAIFPLVLLAAVLPISIGGWGVREGAAIVAFGAMSVPPESAFGLSMLFGLASIVTSLPGSLMWYTTQRRLPPQVEASFTAADERATNRIDPA